MADLEQNSAFAISVQAGADSYTLPSTSDLIGCYSIGPQRRTITVDNPEYNSTVHGSGPFVAGQLVSVTASFVIRGPGGASPPSADAFLLGRIFRSIGFTESVRSSAVPASPEALGAGSTTTKAVLGSSAAGTAGLYVGEALYLAAIGASASNLANYVPIRSYDAAKGAVIPKTLGSAPTGNYQIPKSLTYRFAGSSSTVYLAAKMWRGGKRYDFKNMAFSAARFRWQPSNRDQTAVCTLEVTWDADLIATADEAAPATPILGNPPIFRDGTFAVAQTPLGASAVEWVIEPQTVFPYNPNKPLGNDPGQIARTARSSEFTVNQERIATFDPETLAAAQAPHAQWLQFGTGTGNMVCAMIPDMRLSYPGDGNDGGVIVTPLTGYIDKGADCFTITFPYI